MVQQFHSDSFVGDEFDYWPGPEQATVMLGVLLDGLAKGLTAYSRAGKAIVDTINKSFIKQAETYDWATQLEKVTWTFEKLGGETPVVDLRKHSLNLAKKPRKYPGVSSGGRFERRGL